MLINLIEQIKKTKATNLAVPQKGIVVDNDDDKKLGRVKCWIEELVEENHLWCYPNNPAGLGGSPDLSGFGVPEEGSELIIRFPYDDVYFPVYTGYWQSTNTHQILFDEEYPDEYGFLNSFVAWFRANKATGMAEYFAENGALVRVSEDGDFQISVPGNLVFVTTGDIVQVAGGKHISQGTQVHHNTAVIPNDPTPDLATLLATYTALASQIKTLGQEKKQANLEKAGE